MPTDRVDLQLGETSDQGHPRRRQPAALAMVFKLVESAQE